MGDTAPARGSSRCFEVPFLAFWLCGWAIGEVFALTVIAKGIGTLLTGAPMAGLPQTVAGVLFMGGFMLVWVSFWTLGGLALHET